MLLFTVIYARAFLRLNITTIDKGGGMRRSRPIEYKDHWSRQLFTRAVGENRILSSDEQQSINQHEYSAAYSLAPAS